MRINSNMVPGVIDGIQKAEQSLQTALQQLSTGLRVNRPSDDPTAAAALIQNLFQSGQVDQYTQSITSVTSRLQMADSALSAVVTSLTKAVTLGTQGGDATLTTANRQALADQVSGILNTVVSQANLSYQGASLFAGSATDTPPFVADSSVSGYKYVGNSEVNSVPVGNQFSVPVNVPGDQIFTKGPDVLGSLGQLMYTLNNNGTTADISAATTAVSTALSYVSQQRVFYGNTESQLTSQDSFLQQETVTLKSQQISLVGIDLAVAATNVSQATLARSATLAAAAKVLPDTLLNYLK